MGLQVETVTETCRAIAQQLHDRHNDITLHFVVHRDRRRSDALGKAAGEVAEHPAAAAARDLLTQAINDEKDGLIGAALARENLFLGLAVRDSLLALATINVERFDSMKDVRAQAWHLVWHAMDALEHRKSPAGSTAVRRETITRKRTDAEMAAANLRADVFATVMAAFQGSGDAVPRLAKMRGVTAMQGRVGHRPELYPFPITAESAGLLLGQIKQKSMSKKKWMDEGLRTARQIAKTVDAEAVSDWISFATDAQDMAWRGYNGEQILGAAMNTSDNTQIRSLAHLIAEITGIKPVSVFDLKGDYSPFATETYNEQLHERTVDLVFNEAMIAARRQRSAEPLIDTANSQNLKLLSGHLLGWCAGALQASARAWAAAGPNSSEAYDAAKREFETERSRTAWSALRELSGKIVTSYRENVPVTLGSLLEMSSNDRNAETLMQSIEETMEDHERQSEMEPSRHVSLSAGTKAVDTAGLPPSARLSANPASAKYTNGGGEESMAAPPRSRK
jgi:hypothetical protein